MIKIAVVDDHDLFREGIKLILNQTEGFDVIFTATDGNSFLHFLDDYFPEVVLMDISMPGISGIETTKRAMQLRPDLKIIALTAFSDAIHYTQMIQAGAKGFVLKKSGKYELQQAVSTVVSGGNYFSHEIMQKLAFQAMHLPDHSQLTAREMEIMSMVCKGYTSLEISGKLFISIKTVETHRGNIFQKAGVRNAAELIIWAVKNSLFSIE